MRCGDESELVEMKLDAYQKLDDQIAEIEPESTGSQRMDLQPRILSESSAVSVLEQIRNAFIEHIGPFHEGDLTKTERLVEVLSREFSPELATALTTGTVSDYYATEVKTGIRTKIDVRGRELESVQEAVEQEQESLKTVEETSLEISRWIVERDDAPLLQRGFDELRSLHETIHKHQEQLEAVAEKRQEVIRNASGNTDVPINHSLVVEKIYDDFPVTYPGLADIATVSELCTDVQSAVCRHLSRRA